MELSTATIHLEHLAASKELLLIELLVDIRRNPADYSAGIRTAFNRFIAPADEFFGANRGVAA